MNDLPSSRQIEALRDLVAHPSDTLRLRGERLGISHSAVLALFSQCERRELAMRMAGHWQVTKQGRAWLRPAMAGVIP